MKDEILKELEEYINHANIPAPLSRTYTIDLVYITGALKRYAHAYADELIGDDKYCECKSRCSCGGYNFAKQELRNRNSI